MVSAKGWFLMWLLSLMFLQILLYTSFSFSSARFPPFDSIRYHNCRCFEENLGRPDEFRQPNLTSWVLKLWRLVLPVGFVNTSVNVVISVIVVLNIIVYKLRKHEEEKHGDDKEFPLLSSEHICRQFSLAELELATKNFDQAMVIGKGGFGKVYKGFIDHGATVVAIKRLESRSKQGASEFWTEIKVLSKFRHNNLVSLIGYCDDFDEMILVYEHVSGGNLGQRLYAYGSSNNRPLSWVERLKICIGAARALDYLHSGAGVRQQIVHRDVKSSNILLDEHITAKVSDLGVSRIFPADQPCTHVSTDVKGSFGYFDPHYFLTHKLTRKSDVYAFGVVLLEVLCGRPAIDSSLADGELGIVGWAQGCIREGMLYHIVDPSLKGRVSPYCLKVRGQFLPNSLNAFVQIAEKCLRSHPRERPTMAEVVVGLESALALQQRAHSSVVTRKMGDGGHHHGSPMQSYIKSSKVITFSRMLRDKLGVKTPRNTAHGDEKSAEKIKRHSKCFLPRTLSSNDDLLNRNGVSFQKVPSSQEFGAPHLKIFSLAGLRRATSDFSQDMVVGEGAYGRVYLGWVQQETYTDSSFGVGMAVAVKKLSSDSYQGREQWQTEVNFLGQLSHPNLIKLLGYCMEDEELILVYEFMNGSLEGYILTKIYQESLSWAKRLKILIGTARGVAFLHTRKNPVIYRDLKSANILVDQDFNAKIADFGMARLGPINGDTHVSTRVMGTIGYAAPEYIATGHLNVKNDIYAFGVLLLETLTGLPAIDSTRPDNEENLVDWARPLLLSKKELKRIICPSLGHDYPPEAAFKCAALVLKCTQLEPKKRPSMEEVLRNLERISRIETKPLKDRARSCMTERPSHACCT